MIKKVYAVKDVKASVFNNPFLLTHDVEAIRSLQSCLRNEKTLLSQYPSDFELWHIADFDDETARFNQSTNHRFIISCQSLIENPTGENGRKAVEPAGTQAKRSEDDKKKSRESKLEQMSLFGRS